MSEQSNRADVVQPIDARAEIKVSDDRLQASLTLTEPLNGGAPMSIEKLAAVLAQKGIKQGVSAETLDRLARSPVYGQSVVVAKGVPSVNGEDAVMTYHINLNREMRPKERPDGSVDFKDLGLIETVTAGDKLCTKTPPTPGTPGIDVYGNVINQRPGKDMPMPMGKNTKLSEDSLTLMAAITGQADLINNRINVLDTYTVKGNVSTATGDINFVGNVVVTGGVSAGFTIQASGSVDIQGIVEGARIMAGGSIIIRGGFNGGESGILNSGANVTCRFIQGGRVVLSGNLETTYIMNADIRCGGIVNLTGKGLIMGGRVTARTSVCASYLGSANTTSATVIEVGSDPELVKRAQELPGEMESCAKNLHSVSVAVKTLTQLKAAGRLTPDKAAILEKSLLMLEQLKTTQLALQAENAEVQEKLAEVGNGTVRVSNTAYPGVRIIIGSEQFPLQSEYQYTCFNRSKGVISAGPYR